MKPRVCTPAASLNFHSQETNRHFKIKALSRQTDLEAAGVDDLVADGALHQREAELLIL